MIVPLNTNTNTKMGAAFFARQISNGAFDVSVQAYFWRQIVQLLYVLKIHLGDNQNEVLA